MRTLAFVALLAALAVPAAKAATPPHRVIEESGVAPGCAAPLASAGGKALDLKSPLSEQERRDLSALVFLALTEARPEQPWPGPEIEAAAPCVIATFEVGDQRWSVSANTAGGVAPPRWARTPGLDDYLFLALAPGFVEARAWREAPTASVSIAKPLYLLVGGTAKDHYVFRIYDGAPDQPTLVNDMATVAEGKTGWIAAFDPGGAVSLGIRSMSGLSSEVFFPRRVHARGSVRLLGPDGDFFRTAQDADGLILAGSGFVCPDAYGPFLRLHQSVLDGRPNSLDLACHYEAEESWITLFVTKSACGGDGPTCVAISLKDAQKKDLGRRLPDLELAGGPNAKLWRDKTGRGQALWVKPVGDFVVEARATFTASEKDATEQALRDIAGATNAGRP